MLQKFIQKFPSDIDCAMITSPISRRYLTGFNSSAGTLVITPKKAYFIVDFRYYEMACGAIDEAEIILRSDEPKVQLIELLSALNVKSIGVEDSYITISALESLKKDLQEFDIVTQSGISEAINALRAVKNVNELEAICVAQAITDKAFEEILNYIKEGITEHDIAVELEHIIKRLGGGIAFDTIVASGENSAKPHAVPTNRMLCKGDLVTLDFGASFNGYASDMTRTIGIGSLSEKQQDLYNCTLQAQELALKIIAPYKRCCDIDKEVRDYIDMKYKGKFAHGLGHSVGLEIHENPSFNRVCDDILLPSMVITVEPGIYLQGEYGVRIEDLVVINEESCKNITKSEKKLLIL